MKKRLITVLKFVVFLGLGIFLLWLITKDLNAEQKEKIRQGFIDANYLWVGLAVIAGLLSHASRAVRWQMLIKPLGYVPRFSVTFFAVIIGYMANMAFPRLGEVLKCGVISKYEKVRPDKLIGTMIVERSIDVVCLLAVTILMLVTQFAKINGYFQREVVEPLSQKASFDTLTIVLIAIGGILFLAGAVYAFKKIKTSNSGHKAVELVKNVKQGFTSILKMDKPWVFIGHTIFIWFMYLAMVLLCFPALEGTSGLGFGAAIAILVFGSVGIIATPGGIGAYQIIVISLLTAPGIFEIAKTDATTFSWLVWSAQTLTIIVVGVIGLIVLPLLPEQKRQHEELSSALEQGATAA